MYGESETIWEEAVRWFVDNGDNERLRIVLTGYDNSPGAELIPDDWRCLRWKAKGGYGNQGVGENVNASRECIWLSPYCLDVGDSSGGSKGEGVQTGIFDA